LADRDRVLLVDLPVHRIGALADRPRTDRRRLHDLRRPEPDRRGEPQSRAWLSGPHPGRVPGRAVIDPDRRRAGGRLPLHHRTRLCVPRHHGVLGAGCAKGKLAQYRRSSSRRHPYETSSRVVRPMVIGCDRTYTPPSRSEKARAGWVSRTSQTITSPRPSSRSPETVALTTSRPNPRRWALSRT